MADELDARLRCWAAGIRLGQLLYLNMPNRFEDAIYDLEQYPVPSDPEATRAKSQRDVMRVADLIDRAVSEARVCGGVGGEFDREWSTFHGKIRVPPSDLGAARQRLNDFWAVTLLLDKRAKTVGPPEHGASAPPVPPPTSPAAEKYGFINAEEYWDSLNLAGREALLRSFGEDPTGYKGLGERPLGTLGPDAIDAIEGLVERERQKRAPH